MAAEVMTMTDLEKVKTMKKLMQTSKPNLTYPWQKEIVIKALAAYQSNLEQSR